MNVSAVGAAAVLFASLAVTSASANVSSSRALGDVAASPSVSQVDFVQGHESIAGMPARQALVRAEASRTASAQYFDFDVIVTLGALAIASGAFVAAGIAGSRRRVASGTAVAGEGWRDEVMHALEVDLEQFTSGLRRAA